MANNKTDLELILKKFGDRIGEEKHYGIEGLEAVYLYLVKTYHWTPAQVKEMSLEDIRFVLTFELNPANESKGVIGILDVV